MNCLIWLMRDEYRCSALRCSAFWVMDHISTKHIRIAPTTIRFRNCYILWIFTIENSTSIVSTTFKLFFLLKARVCASAPEIININNKLQSGWNGRFPTCSVYFPQNLMTSVPYTGWWRHTSRQYSHIHGDVAESWLWRHRSSRCGSGRFMTAGSHNPCIHNAHTVRWLSIQDQ